MPIANRSATDLAQFEGEQYSSREARWTVERNRSYTLVVTGWERTAAGRVKVSWNANFLLPGFVAQYAQPGNNLASRFPNGSRLNTGSLDWSLRDTIILLKPDKGRTFFFMAELYDDVETAMPGTFVYSLTPNVANKMQLKLNFN